MPGLVQDQSDKFLKKLCYIMCFENGHGLCAILHRAVTGKGEIICYFYSSRKNQKLIVAVF